LFTEPKPLPFAGALSFPAFCVIWAFTIHLTKLEMARKIRVLVDTTINQLVIQDYDNASGNLNNQYYGGFGNIRYEQGNQLQNMSGAADTIRLIWADGATGFFNFGEIEDVAIDGGSVSATDLAGVITAMAPYFFVDGVADIAIDYPVTSATTELDFETIGHATIIQLTSADSAMTISRILNIPPNREIKIFPPLGATLTITRRMQVAMDADWQILSDGNHTVQGSNGEWVKVSKFVSATWTICRVDSYKTNLF